MDLVEFVCWFDVMSALRMGLRWEGNCFIYVGGWWSDKEVMVNVWRDHS